MGAAWARTTRWICLSLLATAAPGCVTFGYDDDVAWERHGLAHPGPWDIPTEIALIGDTQYVEYTGAGPWIGEAGCSGSFTDGAEIVRDFLYENFPQITHIGGYSCRQNTGNTSQTSVHGSGRALDVMLPTVGNDEADNDIGDPIGNFLVENAELIGIQYIIWDQWTWGAHRSAGNKESSYGGPSPHTDHLHVEVSLENSKLTTDWFSEQVQTPPPLGCEPLPEAGGTIDETDACFWAFGPQQFWRAEAAGHGGSLLWTDAWQTNQPSNWARWYVLLEQPGDYRLEVYVEGAYAAYANTEYAISHDGQVDQVFVDQSAADGWVDLGVFYFSGVESEHLSVFDDTGDAVPDDQHIVVDALRVTPPDASGGSGGAGGGATGGSGGATGGAGGGNGGAGAGGAGGGMPGGHGGGDEPAGASSSGGSDSGGSDGSFAGASGDESEWPGAILGAEFREHPEADGCQAGFGTPTSGGAAGLFAGVALMAFARRRRRV